MPQLRTPVSVIWGREFSGLCGAIWGSRGEIGGEGREMYGNYQILDRARADGIDKMDEELQDKDHKKERRHDGHVRSR